MAFLTLERGRLLSLQASQPEKNAPRGAGKASMSHLQLRAADGHTLSAYLAKPAGRARGAVVVIQEIFGVTGHIERVADQFAAEGYLAIAPALFDRQQRGVNLAYDTAGTAHGLALAHAADENGLMADLDAAIAAVAHAGAVGMVGYCWGGRVVYQAGSRTNIAAGVVYYGGGITQVLEPAPKYRIERVRFPSDVLPAAPWRRCAARRP